MDTKNAAENAPVSPHGQYNAAFHVNQQPVPNSNDIVFINQYPSGPYGPASVGHPQQPIGPNPIQFVQSPNVIAVQPPATYAGLAMFSCLCCFWPLGMLAIYKSSQVNTLYGQGNLAAAKDASSTARNLSLISIGIGAVIIVGVIIYYFTAFQNIRSSRTRFG